ncbi:MAG: hypothetical protein V3S01_10280 [Dehalococcoidia bacterium]
MTFDYKKFVAHMETWVDGLDEPVLNRTWEVVKECVAAHASIDREDTQTPAQAREVAWLEFVAAWSGNDSTFTMFGMVHEISGACADAGRGEELDAVFATAIAEAGGSCDPAVEDPVGPDPPEPSDFTPKLYLILNPDLDTQGDEE